MALQLDKIADNKNIKIEIDLFLSAILAKYGYDFTKYGKAHIRRRIEYRLSKSNIDGILDLTKKVLYDEKFFHEILYDFSINVTEMFRDPSFYKSIRENVIPILKTFPFIKIWHAGCSTGEEVYSMAILLKEEGLLDKTQIYATDFNVDVLATAKDGIYPNSDIEFFSKNYTNSGGKEKLENYYTSKYDSVIMNSELKKNIVFADHNLVQDSVFGEMNLIMCRNVLIYFNKDLQDRVFNLFNDSLIYNGILAIGSKETTKFSKYAPCFGEIDKHEKIYRKIKK